MPELLRASSSSICKWKAAGRRHNDLHHLKSVNKGALDMAINPEQSLGNRKLVEPVLSSYHSTYE